MDTPPKKPNGKSNERFQFMEWRLYWEGKLNRQDIRDQFNISKPQVSIDLRKYREKAGENINYDSTRKFFVPSSKMKPKFMKVSTSRLLLQLRAYADEVIGREDIWFKKLPDMDALPNIRTDVRPIILRRVLRAIRRKRSINISYRSLNGVVEREIAPHALAFDGNRWHTRAWCFKNSDFRDFVLTRIEKSGKTQTHNMRSETDLEWEETVELILHAHPDLSKEQQLSIAQDYGMVNGQKSIHVKHAMVFYLIQNLDLDIDGLPPKRAQIRLLNRRAVFEKIGWKTLRLKKY